MPVAASAGDPHLEQAQLAQPPPRAYQDGWRSRYAAVTRPGAPPPAAPDSTTPVTPSAARAGTGDASQGTVPAPAGGGSATAAIRAAQAAEPPRVAHPKPVAPALKPGEREAGRLKALQMTQERKQIRDQLRQGSLSLAQALAQDKEAARGMRVVTVVRALPGIGAATAARLMAQAGIDGGHRVGGLTAGQRERLVAAVAVVDAELAARHGHRVTIPASAPAGPRSRRGGGAVPRAVLAHPAPGQIPSARPSGGPRR